MSYGRVALLCGLLALVAVAGGCQRRQTWDLATVKGTVTQDGRPLADIEVVFLVDLEAGTQGPRASGITNATGHYEMHTDVGDQGAAIGRYRVCLHAPPSMALNKQSSRRRTKVLNVRVAQPPALDPVQLPPAYSSFAETPLRAEVHPGPQTLNFDVPK